MGTNYRIFYGFLAFLELLFFGGLHFGWGSLVYVLKEDGIFSELCSVQDSPCRNDTADISHTGTVDGIFHETNDGNELKDGGCELNVADKDVGCPEQDQRLVLVFALGSGLFCVGAAVMGRINFQFGTRKTRLCALITFLAGCLLTAFTSKDQPWCILPGITFLGVGGIPLLVTNAQLSVLFPTYGAVVVGIFNGAYDTSAGFVPLMIKLLHDKGVALRWSMLTIGGLHLLTLVSTFCFLPSTFISKTDVDVTYDRPTPSDTAEDQETERTTEAAPVEPKKKSLMSCVLSPFYLLQVTWFCLLQLRFYYFLSSVNSWLQDILSSEQEVAMFTDVLQYTMMGSLIVSLLPGAFYDLCKRQFAASPRQDRMSAVLPMATGSLLAMLLSALALFRVQAVVYLSFVVVVVLRSFLYTLSVVFLIAAFPGEYMGMLYGLMLLIGGIFGCLQYLLYEWVEASGYTLVNGVLIVMMAASLAHPIYLWFTCRRRGKNHDNKSSTAQRQ